MAARKPSKKPHYFPDVLSCLSKPAPNSDEPTTKSTTTLCSFLNKNQHKIEANVFSPVITPKRLPFLKKVDGHIASLKPIGKGGCGEVYSAVLPGQLQVAIKKIVQPFQDTDSNGDNSHFTKKMRQIRSEIQTVGEIRHPNLLPLLAYLPRPDRHYLVYEYMKNGSLEDCLSDGRRELDWPVRYKIALGIAAGLEYLHMHHSPRIIHRDLKPANVLLDDQMGARITDFGLAAAVPDNDTHVTTRHIAGTVGYIAPEYYQTFKFTEKCDVYSFGVVLAALVTGKLPSDVFFRFSDEVSLVKWMRGVVASGIPKLAIDPRLVVGNGEEEEQMVAVLRVAWCCTAENPKERPNSKEARLMLQPHLNA